jgi:hypothetical protein
MPARNVKKPVLKKARRTGIMEPLFPPGKAKPTPLTPKRKKKPTLGNL